MGDFNVNLDHFHTTTTSSSPLSWKYALINHLHKLHFTDLQETFSTPTSAPTYTFTSPQHHITSRLDAIFISLTFLTSPFYCHTHQSFLYLSDHHIVVAYFQKLESTKEKYEKRLRLKRCTYNLFKMDSSDWIAFANYIKKYYKEHSFHKLTHLKSNYPNLNKLWSHIKTLLVIAEKKTVLTKSVSPIPSTQNSKYILPNHQVLS